MIGLVSGLLLLCGTSWATVTQMKVADSNSLTVPPLSSVYETKSVTVTIDPGVTNWIALSSSDNLVQLPTGDNNNIPFGGTPQINQTNTDDYIVVTVSKGSAVSSAITLDDNDAYNCRIGNQAVISGSYPAVRAVNCVDWSKNPPVTHAANFAESGPLTGFFTANGKGDYTFKIDFANKYGTSAGHGAVWLLMDVNVPVTKHQISLPLPAVATPGDPLQWKFEITPGTISGNVDIYALLLGLGKLFTLGPQGLTTSFAPFQLNAHAVADKGAFLPDITLPSALPEGDYLFGAVLVKHLGNLFDPNNWLSNVAVSALRFTLLSPAQQVTINTRGYPEQFIKTFSTQDGQVRTDEAWLYLQLKKRSYFVNGVLMNEDTLDTTGLTQQALGYHPENYSFDTTPSDIISRHGQPPMTQNTPPWSGDFFGIYQADKYFIYNGIIFGFSNNRLVSVMALK